MIMTLILFKIIQKIKMTLRDKIIIKIHLFLTKALLISKTIDLV